MHNRLSLDLGIDLGDGSGSGMVQGGFPSIDVLVDDLQNRFVDDVGNLLMWQADNFLTDDANDRLVDDLANNLTWS